MLHELLVTLSGYPGDIFQPFPPEPAVATTFAITDFPLLHPAEKESLNRLAQLGFYVKEFDKFISISRSPSYLSSGSYLQEPGSIPQPAPAGLYLKALANSLERKLLSYRQVIIQTEAAILSGQDNLGGVVPLSTIAARFAPFQLIFPAIYNLIIEIYDASTTETPYLGGTLINLLKDKAASGVPIQREWMNELLRGCCAVMMRQIVAWVIYGQLQDPFSEFFILQLTMESTGGPPRHTLAGSLKVSGTYSTPSAALPTSSARNVKWDAEYAIDESMIPSMIPTTLAHAMLFIGKSITTARQAKPKPIPIPQSMTQRHLDLISSLASASSTNNSEASNKSILSEVLNINQLTNVIHCIRGDIADHLWAVVQVGEKVVSTLESFRRYFLLCDGEFGLGLIEALEGFKRSRLSRLGQFVTATSSNVSIRDHDLGGILMKAAEGTPAQDDPALRSFELRLQKPPGKGSDTAGNTAMPEEGQKTAGMFDDQALGIPIRLWYTLAWPLDFFLTTEDLKHYGDVFAYLLTVRKAQVKLQQAWLDVKSMSQQMNSRKRGRGGRAYNRRIKGIEDGDESYEQESEALKHIATMRSDMIFVADCLWTYLQTDVIGPAYDNLLHNIITHESEQRHTSNSHLQDSSYPTSRSFDSIHSSHAEALLEIRRACLLTLDTLSSCVKNILGGMETFCGIVARRAAGQDGFQTGLGDIRDKSMLQDWAHLSRLHQVGHRNVDDALHCAIDSLRS
ncbi:gamma-tubulin complex component protein [Dissophora ornata]|nr:gamma-tubulin complex component protein [Dissophora ornata]